MITPGKQLQSWKSLYSNSFLHHRCIPPLQSIYIEFEESIFLATLRISRLNKGFYGYCQPEMNAFIPPSRSAISIYNF